MSILDEEADCAVMLLCCSSRQKVAKANVNILESAFWLISLELP